MQSAEYYLRELLFAYDCVTIPGLGGFIMHSRPSRIDMEKNRIYPQSRYPSFNSLLNHDDGLMISAIARAEKISYNESGLFVHDFARKCRKRLSDGEKILLEGIGEFSVNPEGAIQFRYLSHANFSAAVFGLEPLNIYPVTRKMARERSMQKPADRKPRRIKARQPAAVRWTLLLSIPVVLFLLYGIISPSSIQQLYTNYSGMLYDFEHPQGGKQTIAVQADKYNPVVLNLPDVPDSPVLNSPDAALVEKTVTPLETAIQTTSRYYIIGGCFLSEKNAVKFMQELISRGFEAEKAGSNNRGQIRISYKSFKEKTSALSYLQTIRNEENPSAWLLKY